MTLDFFGDKYPLLLDVCKPLFNPTNRDIKRKMAQEYETIFPKIWAVEKSFYAHVIGENDYDYKTIAHFHHKWMDSVIEHTIREHKPRFWAINENRFKTIIN